MKNTPSQSANTPTQPDASPMPVSTSTTSGVTPTPASPAQAWFDRLTLEQKIGQVLTIGFDGTEPTPALLEMITQYHIGGVILFARNVASPLQVARLTNALQKAALDSGHPGLIIAIDQEGGRVARLTEDKGFTEFPGAMAVAAASPSDTNGIPDPKTTESVYAAIASELRAVGLNTDFAPDLDVNNNPQNPVIGLRSFSSDPRLVSAFGIAAVAGLQKNDIMAFGKHFPGHGDTGTDSHTALPVIPHDRNRLAQVEFVPFKAAMQAGAAGIMSAHVVFPAIESTANLPATLSPAVMHTLIREEMGYEGLLVTDSLEMGALGEAGYPVPLAAATALQSGADLLLFNRDHALHQQAYQQIRQWVDEGKIPTSRLDEAVHRILRAKQEYGLLQPQPVDENAIASQVATQSNLSLSRDVAARSITLLRNEGGLVPLAADGKYLLVETPNTEGLSRRLSGQNTFSITTFSVSADPKQSEINLVVSRAQSGQIRAVIVLTADANRSERQAALIQALMDAKIPVIAIATRNPYDILAFPQVDAYLITYGANPPAFEALAGILSGQIKPQGKLPVDIPGLYAIGDGL